MFANKLQYRKVWKHCKSPIHSVGNVGNDYLNYVCIVSMMRVTIVEISLKPRGEKINYHFEKFENPVNLLYTVFAMLEMII